MSPRASEKAAAESVDPGEVTAGEGSPSVVSQAEWVILFRLVGPATIGQQLGGLGLHLLGLWCLSSKGDPSSLLE